MENHPHPYFKININQSKQHNIILIEEIKNHNPEFLKQLSFEPLSINNWNKFVQLFGNNGACGNCWCMLYRLKKSDFDKGKLDSDNMIAMKNLVLNNNPTGLLGFYEGQPIVWCAFAPRQDFEKLENSRVHKRIDNNSV